MGNRGSFRRPVCFIWTIALVLMLLVTPSPTIGGILDSVEADLDLEGNVGVADFFRKELPDGDLTKVTWAHAVNSDHLLTEALRGDVMMLEADILMGTKVTGSDSSTSGSKLIPIMAHPPNKTSDLSFDDFLKRVIKANKGRKTRKGIKLDFKDIEALVPVLEAIERSRKKKSLDFPIWVNADIWKGPYHATRTPIDPSAFLSAVLDKEQVHITPTLSLGWTTRYGNETGDSSGGHITTGEYRADQVAEALHTLSTFGIDGSSREVTFPVRAGLAAQSKGALANLVDSAGPRASLTIWSKEGDEVDIGELEHLIESIGRSRVYLDVPFQLPNYPQGQGQDQGHDSTTSTSSTERSHSHEHDEDSDTTEKPSKKPSSKDSSKSKKQDKRDKKKDVDEVVDKAKDKVKDEVSGKVNNTTGGQIHVVDDHHVVAGAGGLTSVLFTSLIMVLFTAVTL